MASTYISINDDDGSSGGGGGGSGVDSFNGRTGPVVSVSGDYSASQITNVPAGNISSTNVQAAINELDTEKQAVITGAATTITSSNLTVSRAVVSDGSGKIAVATTTAAEIGFVNGVTSAIQTQLNAKEPSFVTLPISKGGTNSGTALNNNRNIISSGGAIVESAAITASRALASDASGIPVAATTTVAELNFVNGVTSAIQTQLNNKQPLDATLTSLAAYNTNGILTQTAADTFTGRTITGTASNITVTNGSGVAGNPTIDLPNTAVVAGTFLNATITVDAKGRLTAAADGIAAETNMNTSSFGYEEFEGNTGIWKLPLVGTSSGAAAADSASAVGIDASEKCIGVHRLASGTALNGRTTVSSNSAAIIAGYSGLTFDSRMMIDSLGSAINTFVATVGFIDNTGAGGDHVDGAYFRFTGNATSTNWECITSATSVRTTTTTTSAGLAGIFQRFRVEINEAGTSVTFFIDDLLVATHSTNIPTGAQAFGYGAKITNTVGTTNYFFYADYYKIKITWSGGR